MAWHALPLSMSAGAHLPPLLMSTAFTASSFAVHLTDLTHIWSENLNRATIVQRSREEGTSIDPSETGQLKIFLEKIKLGLAGGKGTALALTINGDPDRPSLVLSVSVNLPGGLQPLQWPVRLSAAPQTLLTSHLTMPLLQKQHVHMQEMAGLMDVLKDKDHVIQKLLDKLEEQGTELGQIFPQAAGKVGRKVDRKKAEDKVRGIARFDVDAWRQGLSNEQPEDVSKLISDVLSAQTDIASTEFPAGSEEQENWWDDIKGLTVHLDSGKISTKGPSKTNKSKSQPILLDKDETQQEDDAFQTQSTPPPVATTSTSTPAKPTSKSTQIDNSTEEDDEDLDAPSQRSRVADSFPISPPPPSPKPAKKLGGLGKKKAARQTSPPTVNDTNDDKNSTADETAPRFTNGPKRKTTSPTPESVAVPHRPQKKLGKLGGKKAAPPSEPESLSEPERDPEPQHSSTEDDEPEEKQKEPSFSPPPALPSKSKKGKLGSLGRKTHAAATSASVEPDPDPEIAPVSTPPASTPPETQSGSVTVTPKRKLGELRGSKKNKKDDGVKEEESSQRGRGSSPLDSGKEKTKTPEPRETSLERADRKREALKRELEEKAKAPVKKKRKF
ncbi:XRCC4-like factor-domain-containing protein [Cadophora sp. MPI-SDFR-AT-0126]|nr:XRCC4-like factor-domain-containing protein [Leotiomycetes sp. MPI-SDFR-AT-0126]